MPFQTKATYLKSNTPQLQTGACVLLTHLMRLYRLDPQTLDWNMTYQARRDGLF